MDDILGRYTMDQIQLFLRAGIERHKREMSEMAVAMRAAFVADQKVWKKFLSTMSPAMNEKVVDPSPKTKADLGLIARLLKYGK